MAEGRLEGKVAIITGGSRGMGASHVRRFVAEGARVMFTDVRADLGRELAVELGEGARFMEHDVSDAVGWARVVQETESTFGPTSVLVNNAGVALAKPIVDTTEADWHRIIAVNQTSVFLSLQAVVPSMRRARGGSIVNISSNAGIVGMPGGLAYCASKWAVRGMTKVAALELGHDNIRVNSVHPGVIHTPLYEETIDAAAGLMDFIQTLPLPRVGQPEEITALVLFLASDESSYSTGAEFLADGGWTTG